MIAPQRHRASRSKLGRDQEVKQDTTPIITLRGDRSDPIYNVRLLDRDCPRAKSIKIKSSTRWLETFKTPNGGLAVPFIDRLGKFTGHTAYKWSCDPRSLIATCVATVASRLRQYAYKHNKCFIVKRHLKSILGAAAYYCFSKNNHFMDRILFFLRNLREKGNLVHKLRLFYSSKMDDHKRFVYSQVCFQTNWLLSQGTTPRDKSHFFSSEKRTIWRKPEDSPSKTILTNTVRDIAYAMSLI